MLTNSFNYIDVNFTVKFMSEKQKYIVDTQLDYKPVCLTIWIFLVRSFLNFKCISATVQRIMINYKYLS